MTNSYYKLTERLVLMNIYILAEQLKKESDKEKIKKILNNYQKSVCNNNKHEKI
jgi:hypothetical protein